MAGGVGTAVIEQVQSPTRVSSTSINPYWSDALSGFDIWFVNEIDPASFDTDDISVTGPQGVIAVTAVTKIDAVTYHVTLDQALPDGTYQLQVGPNIQSIDGYGMDQNQNGIPGEPEDVYSYSFTIDTQIPAPVVLTSHNPTVVQELRTRKITLTGTRSENVSIWINGVERVGLGTGNWQVTNLALKEGLNELVLIAVDEAKNHSAAIDLKVDVDSIAPSLHQVTPSGSIRDIPSTIQVEASDAGSGLTMEGTTVTVTRNGIPVSGSLVLEEEVFIFTPSAQLLEGKYSVVSRLADKRGNVTGNYGSSFTLDYTAPVAPSLETYPAVTTINTYTFKGSKEHSAVVLLGDQVVISGSGTVWQHTLELVEGENLFTFRQRDPAGNLSEPTVAKIRYDNSVPGPVTVVANGEGNGTSVVLDWSAYDEFANGNDIERYHVYVRPTAFSTVEGLGPEILVPAGIRSFTLQGLARNTPVHVAVVAVDQVGLKLNSVTSIPVMPLDKVAPADVTQLTANATATSLKLSWLPSANTDDDLAGYRVHVDKAGTSETHELPIGSLVWEGERVVFSLTDLSAATSYPVRVTTYDNDGNESAGVSDPGVTLLANPSELEAEPFSGKIGLSWAATTPSQLVKQYRVYVESTPFTSVAGKTPKVTVAETARTASVAGLTNGTKYYAAVTAVNLSGGEDPTVIPVEVTPEDDLIGPTISKITHFDGTSEIVLSDGSSITRNGSIRVYAEDPSGLGRVEVLANDISIGTDFTAAPAFDLPWNLIPVADGAHVLKVKAYDTLNNVTEQVLTVNVALEPPAAPTVSSPKNGWVTNQNSVAVNGQSLQQTLVRLRVNGTLQGDVITANGQGQFTGSVTLSEGDNLITAEAAYGNRGVFGAESSPVSVKLDTQIPNAPQSLTAQSKPLGQIALSWPAVDDTRVRGYHVYRSTAAFSSVNEAGVSRVTTQVVKGTTYQDLPAEDGEYIYRVVSVNELDTESLPSPSAQARADSELPRALEIRYSSQGKHDPVTNRVGPGRVDVELVFSEPLRTVPYFAMVVSGGLPMVAELEPDYSDDKLYRGYFLVREGAVSGTAQAVVSAHDQVGNRGTDVVQGKTLVIDTQGPEVAQLQLNPSEPIQNDPDQNGLGREVEVILTLADEVKDGEQPKLVPFIFDGIQEEVIADYSAGIPLVKDGSSQPGAPVYVGRLRLPLSAGQDANGQPNAEVLGFQYVARDDLDNETTKIAGQSRFQVYQGDLPPLNTPSGLTARALPGGQVELKWNKVDGAAGYVLYRQSPAEAELSPLAELSYPAYTLYIDGVNSSLSDGTYQYAIASLRSQNGQNSTSGMSEPVSVNADATPPDAPENFSLELNGAGVVARWQPPASEVQDGLLTYNLYRLPLPSDAVVTDLTGYTPLQTSIPDIIALDSRPSQTEHLYFVTAVDPAGNESAPSNTAYQDVALLPVSDLQISLADSGRPVLSWKHNSNSLAGFDVFVIENGQKAKLNDGLITGTMYEDISYNDGAPVQGAPVERTYSVEAVNTDNEHSIGHELRLPALSVSLTNNGENEALKRGVMNQVSFRVANAGTQTVVQARLKVTVLDNGTPRVHWSERFAVEPSGFTDVPVIIGGYQNLATLTSLDMQIVLEPRVGEKVQIQQLQNITVGQSGLVATLETEDFIRGATGKARIRLENPSAVETEILMATQKGTKDSTEVRLVLKDLNGNVLSKQAIKQVTGDVVSVSNGDTVARIAAGGTYLSQPFEVLVPSTAPDEVVVHLEIDKFRYHTGRDTFVAIGGTQASQEISLQETPYYGVLTEVSPQTVFAGGEVQINGQSIDRASSQPLANVPLTLVLSVRGFERTFPLYTDSAGNFAYTFKPGLSESGDYRVSVLHPSMRERPEHGSFRVEGAGVSPTQARITIPRNYKYPLNIKVQSGHGTQLNNVRLAYVHERDSNGNELPVPQGMQFELGTAQQIGANQSAYLNLKLSGTAQAADKGTLRFHVMADNKAEPLDTVTVDYFLTEAKPILLSQPSLVDTGVGLGQTQQESLVLKNTGLEQASNLRLTLVNEDGTPAPSWFRLLTTDQLGSVEVGEQKEIQLAFNPDTGVAEGNYYFHVRVQGDNTQPMNIPVLASVTQSGKGSAFFHASDIYTSTLDANNQLIPGLKNVKISLQNEKVLDVKFDLTTNEFGEAMLEGIPAGRYYYRASAFDHESTSGYIWIKPGVTTKENIFLMNKLITVEFSVREITLQDRYEIVLSATYETNVPAPVVLFEPLAVNLPMMKKGEIFQGELTLSNRGLIQADNVEANLPTGDAYAKFEYMVQVPDTLMPGQVVVIPYRIVALQDFEPSGDGQSSGGGCVSRQYEGSCRYTAQCANGSEITGAARTRWSAASGTNCGGGSGGGGGGFFSGGWGGGGGGTTYVPRYTPPAGAEDDWVCVAVSGEWSCDK